MCSSAHVELPGSRSDDVAAYATAAVMQVHHRPGLSSTSAQRPSAPPERTTVSTLCRWPDAKVACGCTAQRRARCLASGARRACPGWPLGGTSDFTVGDWDMISRCQTYLPVRLNELYTATAAQHSLRPSCDHEAFLQLFMSRQSGQPCRGARPRSARPYIYRNLILTRCVKRLTKHGRH